MKLENIFLILIFTALILGNVIIFSTSESFIQAGFHKYDVYSDVENADTILHSIIVFFEGEELDVPEFNSREAEHMNDVKVLYLWTKWLLFALLALTIVIAYYRWDEVKKRYPLMLEHIGKKGLFSVLILVIFVLLMFNWIFYLMHVIFFEAGTWTFDPANEIIVRVFPQGIFFDIAFYSVLFVTIDLALIYFAGRVMSRPYRPHLR